MFNTLPLKNKLMLLFIVIALGLGLVGTIGYINISAMKKNLDELYFGSFVPVNELNGMIESYAQSRTTVFELASGQTGPDAASSALSAGLDTTQRLWQSYTSHYQTPDEKAYIDFVSATLERTDRHIARIIDVCHQGLSIERLSSSGTSRIIAEADGVIRKLREYEKEVAHHERQQLLVTYDDTMMQLAIILVLTTGGVLWLTYALFVSIHRQQDVLETATQALKAVNTKLENASYTDSLTGVYNRRYFNMIFDRELKRAKRANGYLCFMMLDVDHFKNYNDTYGHIEGDKALQAVAQCLQKSLQRPGDFVFRLGGEEFGILITDTTPESARKSTQMLCEAVEAMALPHETSDTAECLTVSIGSTAVIPTLSMDENAILHLADQNLYEAKEHGRNGYRFSAETLRQTPRRPKMGAA